MSEKTPSATPGTSFSKTIEGPAPSSSSLEQAPSLKQGFESAQQPQASTPDRTAAATPTTSFAKTVDLPAQAPSALDRALSLKAAFEKAQNPHQVQQSRQQESASAKAPAYQPGMRPHPNTPGSRQVDIAVEGRGISEFTAEKKGQADQLKANPHLDRAMPLKEACNSSARSGNQVQLENGRDKNNNDRGR